MMVHNIPVIDLFALGLFLFVWISYTLYADFSRWSHKSLPKVMNFHRRRWMHELLMRDLRMPDVMVMGNFVQSAVFFASTAILIIGGLAASLGASEQALEAISALPYVDTPTKSLWELKVVSLIVVFIYAFVKFIWAVRLANYTSVLFNAAPFNEGQLSAEYAEELGNITGLFGQHFNQGLRANFFALAILGWWVNAWFFLLSTAVVLWVLYRREFRSKSLRVVNNLKKLVEGEPNEA